MSNNYAWCLPYLPSMVHSIVEVGSRDCVDAIFLSTVFNCEVIAFEPNPSQTKVCKRNIADSLHSSITLRTEALSNKNHLIDFFAVDTARYDNSGASGLFLIDFSNREKKDPDRNHAQIQIPLKVEAVRWDSLHLPSPELLVMDCEGAELLVLEGFGEELKKVKFVVLEVSQVALGQGACTFRQIDKFMIKNHFKFVASSYEDRLYLLLAKLFCKSFKRRMKKPFGKSLRGFSFDVIYRNTLS